MEKTIIKIIEYFRKEKILCTIGLSIFIIIRILYSIYLYEFKYKTDENIKKMYVQIVEKRKIEDDKKTYLVKFENSKFIMNIYENNNVCYEVGDILKIRGKIIIPECLNNPYEFNYKRYLNSMNIIGVISTYNVQKIGESLNNFYTLSRFKDFVLQKSENILNKDEKTLFNYIICGIKDYNENTIQSYFRYSGSSHNLAISGTHILYFIYVLELFIQNFKPKLKKNIKIISVSLLNIMVGFNVSIARASIMYIISNIDLENYKINKYIKLIISFLIIFSYNPYVIFSVSFVFSFLSIISIIMVLPLINSYFEIIILKIFGLKYMDNNFLKLSKFKKFMFYCIKYILGNVAFSLSILIFTIPFQMYFFCELNFISILSNILLTPLIFLELVIGYLAFFLVYIPYVSDTIFLANNVILSFILLIVKKISSFKFLIVSVIKPDILSMFSYYVILIIYLFSKYLYKFFSIEKVIRIKKGLKLVTLFLSLYMISIYIKVSFFEEYVYFFNVGQGNMALLHKFNTNIVVDLGSTSEGVASNILINFLKAKNISKLDMIIITHMHSDHMNGVGEVIENVKVSKVVFSSFEDKDKTQNYEFEGMVKSKDISVINVGSKDNILYKDFEINILSPPKNKIINSNDVLNANSLVVLISKNKYNYLFLGDATKETERFCFKENTYDEKVYQRLKSLYAVQIGHHGSKTSTSNLLLENVNSCIAIISSKKKNFGHPSNETLEILENYDFDIRITEKEGAIKIK